MKKIALILTLFILNFITSCKSSLNFMILPNLDGMSRKEIEEVLDDYDVSYSFEFAYTIIENDSMLDKFVKYGGDYQKGNFFSKENHLRVYTTVLPLDIAYSKELHLDIDYTGKSFINDGIGEVKLVSSTDGDTARFKDLITGEIFRLRFLGIDTPETYAGEDPWGKAATMYTKNRLINAETIVLEAEGARTENYGRYLGFVWVDGVLLNLEIVEQAYSNSTLSNSKYKQVFLDASLKAMSTGRRFYGELDPEYDYTNNKFY